MKNKFRLYLAYWRRTESAAHPGKYHVGLILSPKDPQNEEGEATIYHVINSVDKDSQKEVWTFQNKPRKARTVKLAGVMLLGKIPPGFDIDKIPGILENISVPTAEEANATGWRCRHWVLDAMQLLANGGIISTLPSSPQDLWRVGHDFVEAKTDANNGFDDLNHRVPTCDMNGKEIRSEIGPLG